MFTFLFGSPGSGKTAYIMDKIHENINKGQKTYLLVPEQQQFISECMLRDLPGASALYFEVISFSRLCEIVFSKYGGIADAKVGSGIKNLIMWKTLRELSGELSQYKGVKIDSAFIQMMLSSVDELHANSISSLKCEKAAQKCDEPILSRKLNDMGAIYDMYRHKLSVSVGDSCLLSEDKIQKLAEVLSENNFFNDTEIFIDSFTDFTGEEFAVLKEIILQAKSTCISFAYKPRSGTPHTRTLADTISKLKSFLKRRGIDFGTLILEQTSDDVSEIDTIERYLWKFGTKQSSIQRPKADRRGAVESYECENEYEEAWLAALKIIKAVQAGYKYSDIAIITRDPESRRGMLEAVLDLASIPYFFSERTDLSATAPARLVLSALRCVTHKFNQADVINLLKTGLCGIDRRDADLFEDYCYTWNINGRSAFDQVWSMNADGYTTDESERGLEIRRAANDVRARLIPPLITLQSKLFAANGNTVESCRAIYNYLDEIGLEENLSSLAEYSLAAGNVKEAGELLRIYDFIISALTDICKVMKDETLSPDEITSAVEIMLKNTDIGSVPAINDCVTVGSAATLRVENVKVAIVLGLCEGEFPASYSDSGILTEADKEKMESYGISLTSRESKVISDELFYAYRAMTKPQDKLIVSTCHSTVAGRAMSPSTAWTRLHFVLPYLKPKSFDLSRVRTLAKAIREDDADLDENDTDSGIYDEIDYTDGAIIDPAYVRSIFGDNLHLSKSRITTFVECPYKYWCEYVLRLRERKVSEISYDNAGTIIHYVLENLVRMLLNKDGSLERIDDETLISHVNRIIEKYVGQINCPLPPFTLHNISRLRDLALIMAKSVISEFADSSFKVVGLEKHISDRRSDALKPMKITLDKIEGQPTVSLGGVIDRVDCYDDGVRKYIRVIDYKTGTHTFDADDITSGEDVQLPAYLFTAALEQNKSIFGAGAHQIIVPAAALFLSAEEKNGKIDPVRRGFILKDDEVINASSRSRNSSILAGISYNKDGSLSARSRAAVSEDDIKIMKEQLISTVKYTAEDMYSGEALRCPSQSACKFCSVKSSCPVANKD